MSRIVVINGKQFQRGRLTPKERFEFYKALAPGKNFQMLAPSLKKGLMDGGGQKGIDGWGWMEGDSFIAAFHHMIPSFNLTYSTSP
jgi:hypothetical protein